MEAIAAAAGDVYRAKGQESYLNDDGSFNMDGLNTNKPRASSGSTTPPETPAWAAPKQTAEPVTTPAGSDRSNPKNDHEIQALSTFPPPPAPPQ